MTAPWHALLRPLALGIGLIVLALLALVWNGAPPPVHAAGPICTVCLGGGCNYTAVQAAVDDPGCTEIKVAQGVYSGVQGRPAPAGYPNPPASGLITQVVYISRPVTVRGGYTTTNWTAPDPWIQPTTLDANGLGRVLVVAGNISSTFEGLGLTNGRAAGLGGHTEADSGGGGYVISATATLSACRVFSNTAGYGGGLLLWHSPAALGANSVTSNTATGSGGGLHLESSSATLISNSVTANAAVGGGGLYLRFSDATLSANNVTSNTANQNGGGLAVYNSAATLSANSVTSNTAHQDGGGLYLFDSAATLSANSVTSNTAHQDGGGLEMRYGTATLSANNVTSNTANQNGGGLALIMGGATLISNSVTGNTAFQDGGGLYLNGNTTTLSANGVASNTAAYAGGGLYLFSSAATLTNTVVADNRAGTTGSGLAVLSSSTPRLLHATIARNTGGDGRGLYVATSSITWLTNTILVSQTTGIAVAAGSAATMNSTLWYSNTTNWSGAGTLTHTGDYTGPPAFADPGAGDYHIGRGSAAIDRGVDAGVATDKDGRPRDAWPDLGAYEAEAPAGPTCTVCLDGVCDYTVVQRAVDNATCTEIKVAQGVYTGVQGRSVPAGYPGAPASGLITQVVYISRTVTVRGGYTTTNWTVPDPQTQPTTLDAGGLGRVLVVAGDISPTIDGLELTDGNAAGLGGTWADGGGGAYVLSATATLSTCRVFGNAADYGGGLLLWYSPATLSANSVTSNTAADGGGGLLLNQSSATLISNSVTSNTASSGGGLYLNYSAAVLTNTVVADNQAGATGSGLYIDGASPRLLHTTIARNGGDGSGLYVANSSTAWLTNTILVSQMVGITVAAGTANLSNTLWYGNSADWGGAGTIAHSGDYTGPPAFVDPDGGDYHIGPGSAAIDHGVSAGVTTDKDGQPRDAWPDLGAYEYKFPGPTCTVCLDGSCDYTAVQVAVDNIRCTEIKVAQGVYTGAQGRPVPAGYDSPPVSGLITQVVYISRTVTVRGGYTTTNWTVPDPWTQPTTLDAGGLGRALVIAGDVSPTIEGLGLTNGDAAGLGGLGGTDGGGGVYIINAAATLSACRVFSNTAPAGSGLLLRYSPTTLNANHVTSNTAADGGGLYLDYSGATLISNSVTANTAANLGGGLYLDHSDATLISNSITANTAGHGGGLYLTYSPATLTANSVVANTSFCWGGGLYLFYSNATLSANDVISNTADCQGGGLHLQSSAATLINTVVADNRAGAYGNGSGLYIYAGAAPQLLHTTIARNTGGDGSGVYIDSVGGESTAWLTNTILAGQDVGIAVAEGSTAIVSGTLWDGTGTYWSGAGTLAHSNDYTGTPAFVDPGAGDYHIGPASAAVDRGVAAGVATDKDGRPRDARPDLGAYELAALRVIKSVDRGPVPPETPLTYTVRTTSTLDIPLAITAFDVLPDQVGCPACGLTAKDLPPGVLDLLGSVSPTATVAYSTATVAPGATWVWLIPNLSVQADYTGTLTNSVVITSAEGAHALYVLTSTAGLPASAGTYTYLPVVVKDAR